MVVVSFDELVGVTDFISVTMSSLINANPTVFTPSQTSIRKTSGKRVNRIWLDGDEESEEDVGVEEEPIDEQEVFGVFESFLQV